MRRHSFTDDYYDKKLWELAWENANREAAGKNWSKNGIARQLSIDTGVGLATIWRCVIGETRTIRRSTRLGLLKKTTFDDFESFRCFIDLEEEKKGDYYESVKEIIGKNGFLNDIYGWVSQHPTFNPVENEFALNTDQIVLLFKLIKSIYTAYATEQLFTTINLVADRSGTLGGLLMHDYFIQLSYVTQTELKTKESLIRSETEMNKIKLRRALENNAQLTRDYIINFSLKEVQNLLILGSPGIGKSTFSRWLCNQWILKPFITGHSILVYVQLKGMDFGNNTNELVHYICNNYFAGEDPRMLQTILRKANSLFCFILDGYDELSENQKERLFFCLQEISSNSRYILTSRAYGVLNTYGLRWDQAIQLDGFDTSNIYNYIDAFLNGNRNSKSTGQLINIINLNPVLADYAHNPLMLSFMVYLYLSSKDSRIVFENVRTRFDLQHQVINWMMVHNKRKITTSLTIELNTAAAKIAYSMELSKIAEYKKGFEPKETEILIDLNKLGIGHFSEISTGYCQFYFNSFSFQEYFASLYIAKSVTPNAFSYILQDSYFWNLAVMIIGGLAADSTSGNIDQLIAVCTLDVTQKPDGLAYYKLILLLSECHSEYLNQKMTLITLDQVYQAYKHNYNDEKLKYSVGESMQRLYFKLNAEHRRKFLEIVLAEMQTNWKDPDSHLSMWATACKHLPTLVKYCHLNEEPYFIAQSLALLYTTLKESVGSDETPVWGIPDFVLSIIQDNSEDFFKLNEPILKTILPLIPFSHYYHRGKIELNFTSHEGAIKKLRECLAKYDEKSKFSNKESIIGLIAIYSFILGRKYKQINESHAWIGQDLLTRAADILAYYQKVTLKRYRLNYIHGPQPFTRLIVEGLFETGDYEQNYPRALELLSNYGDEYLIFDEITKTYCYDYLDKLIHDISDGDPIQLRRLCTMLYSIPALKNKIAFYRDQILNQVIRYILQNEDKFEGVAANNDISYFLSLFFRDEEAMYESDRRYFFEKMLEAGIGHLGYFRNYFFPIVLEKNFLLYAPYHWNYVMTYLSENNQRSIHTALSIFTNPTIYKYETNITYIKNLLVFLLAIRERPIYYRIIENNPGNILAFITRTLLMLKQSRTFSPEQQEYIISLTKQILAGQELRDAFVKDYCKHSNDIVGNAAYIMQYHFDTHERYNLKKNYWRQLEKDDIRLVLIENLYPAYVQNGKLIEKDISKIKGVVGADFIKGLRKYHQQQGAYNYPFDREQFELLCH